MRSKLIYLFSVLLVTLSCSVDRKEETLAVQSLDGITTLVNVVTLPSGNDECPSGGNRLTFGVDINANGTLDSDEIIDWKKIKPFKVRGMLLEK